MKTYFKGIPMLIALIMVTVLFLSACGSNSNDPKVDGNTDSKTDPKTEVTTTEPKEVTEEEAWNQIIEAAKKEGEVAVAGPPGDNFRDAILAFEKAYPEIKVNVQGFSGRDFGPKVIAEHQAGKYLWDVSIGGPNTVISDLIPAKVIAPLPRDLPETKPEINDDNWRISFDDGLLDKEKTYVYAFLAYIQSVYVNRDVISKDLVNSATDLLKPEVKGKIVWNDPRKAGSGNFFAQFFIKEYGEDYLREILNQDIVPVSDLRQQMDWLVRGTYPIAIGIQNDLLNDMKSNGVGLNVIKLDDPKSSAYTQGFGTVSLLEKAPHPNAAKVFINWLLSKEGQEVFVELVGANSRRMDVPIASEDQYAKEEIDYDLMGKEEFNHYRSAAGKIAKEIIK